MFLLGWFLNVSQSAAAEFITAGGPWPTDRNAEYLVLTYPKKGAMRVI